jgi:small GTP-binding protein
MSDISNMKLKVLLMGDRGVGRSSVITRFIKDTFNEPIISTVGIYDWLKAIKYKSHIISLHIWDSLGQERHRSYRRLLYRDVKGILLLYSCNNKDSFQNVDSWIEEVMENAGKNVSIVLIGTKCDLTNRVISWEQGQELANELEIPFLETSAKLSSGINEAFDIIFQMIIRGEPSLQ